MDAVKFIQYQYESLHQHIDVVMQDTTSEQFIWQPPGSANPISTTFVHMLHAEDLHIQTILQEKQRVWELEGWGEKIGLAAAPGQGRNWEETRTMKLDLETMRGYQVSVRAATLSYLERLTDEKLNERVMFFGGSRPVAQVLAALAIHLVGHAGEIAALKGVQGVRGLPF